MKKTSFISFARPVAWFVRIWAVLMICLLATTWRLWTLQTDFPAIPLFNWLADVPVLADMVLFTGMLASLLAIAGKGYDSESTSRLVAVSIGMFFVCAIGAVLLNQHRLQPWLWQSLIVSSVLLTSVVAKKQSAVIPQSMLRLVFLATYLYSAASKFDYQFVNTVGLDMVRALVGLVGIPAANVSEDTGKWLACLLPAYEWIMALGLVFNSTRKLAAVAGMAMHILLIAMFLSIGQMPPVVIWNLLFLVALVCLFLNESAGQGVSIGKWVRETSLLQKSLMLFVVAFPATNLAGVADHWLAWRVYAPNNSRVIVKFLPENDHVNEHAQEFDDRSGGLDGQSFSIAEWSLRAVGVPVYPEDRFQLGVFLTIAQNREMRNGIVVALQSESSPWDGSRDEIVLKGVEEMHEAAAEFRLGTAPRTASLRNIDAESQRGVGEPGADD
ncbi:MAG: hypothetical protein AAF456_13160 [Planctomycetota bacterium]